MYPYVRIINPYGVCHHYLGFRLHCLNANPYVINTDNRKCISYIGGVDTGKDQPIAKNESNKEEDLNRTRDSWPPRAKNCTSFQLGGVGVDEYNQTGFYSCELNLKN